MASFIVDSIVRDHGLCFVVTWYAKHVDLGFEELTDKKIVPVIYFDFVLTVVLLALASSASLSFCYFLIEIDPQCTIMERHWASCVVISSCYLF